VRERREDVRGRNRRHEDLFVAQPLQRELDVLDVGTNRRVALVADRPGADVDAVPVAIAAAPARPLGDALGPRVVVGKGLVLTAAAARVAFLAGGRRLAGEAVEALDDVTEEARLALLAVGDDVDTGLGLPAHHVGDGAAYELRIGRAVVRLTAILRSENRGELVGPRE